MALIVSTELPPGLISRKSSAVLLHEARNSPDPIMVASIKYFDFIVLILEVQV
jgi:hypothetical protein